MTASEAVRGWWQTMVEPARRHGGKTGKVGNRDRGGRALLSQGRSQRLGRDGRVGHDGGHGVELGGSQLFLSRESVRDASGTGVGMCELPRVLYKSIVPTR
jgi:hypothetical protein